MANMMDWRSCYKCQTMFFDMLPEKGACPTGGGHKAWGFAYTIQADVPETPVQQSNWRQCGKCYDLFFDGFPEKGVCPAGGTHQATGYMCVLVHDGSGDNPTRQTNWRYCVNCHAMFFNGFPDNKGVCPSGGGHVADGFIFIIDHWTDEPQDYMDWQEIVTFDLVRNVRQPDPDGYRLWIDPQLVAAARAHSQDLADHPGLYLQTWNGWPGHLGSDGSTPPDRIMRAFGTSGSENVYIHWGTPLPTPQDAFNSWMGEPSHKANLLDPNHQSAGVGIAYGPGTSPQGEETTFFYFTQDFADTRHGTP